MGARTILNLRTFYNISDMESSYSGHETSKAARKPPEAGHLGSDRERSCDPSSRGSNVSLSQWVFTQCVPAAQMRKERTTRPRLAVASPEQNGLFVGPR